MTSSTAELMTEAVAALGGLRESLAKGRKDIEALHRNGALGGQVCSALADLYDRTIARAWQDSVERLPPADRPAVLGDLALVAVGGYGRGDLAPYSDIDLLFLHSRRAGPAVRDSVSGLVRVLWDVGLKLSQSVRTPSGCSEFARADLPMRTSLTETRLIAGNPALWHELQRRAHRLAVSSPLGRYIRAVLQERAKEHQDHIDSANLLEPNVKKSPGGLRDVHLLRWIALPRYGTPDPEMLRLGGFLPPEDAGTLAGVLEFLRRIRNELHFRAGSAQDVLTRDEQVRVAQWLGYETRGPLLHVERFMQHYHRQTTALHDLVLRFAEGARRPNAFRRALNRLFTSREERHFLVNRESVSLAPETGPDALRRAEVLLRLFDLARLRGVAVAHESLERVRAAVPDCEITPEARRRFLEILSNPDGLGAVVRNLHRVGLLGRFIPAFEHARCLMQFNQYHKYTVDEHSIRALEAALWRLKDPGPLGQAYRETRRKDVLHLACLLHDIGKGYEEDHSEVGRKIAEELSRLLGLGEHERQQLVFLVHKHLVMAHTATRRDIDDLATIVQFVRTVGTVETLRMLTILTVADTEAVAPGSLTGWKESLFTTLYTRSMEELSGQAVVADEKGRAEKIREELRSQLGGGFPADWLASQLEAMPLTYLLREDAATIGAHLKVQQQLGPDDVRVEGRYDAERGLTQHTVFTRDGLVPGLFSKITGVLAAERFQIVDAQILTRKDGRVVDTFRGVDTDFKGEPPAHRLKEVGDQIEAVLKGRQTVEALFASRRDTTRRPGLAPSGTPTQVEIDNTSSDSLTIVEVFADDRMGLLYTIARTLFELGISIASAKISTRLDQVVDVFYVTDAKGAKVVDEGRLTELRSRLLQVLDGKGS
jgi:[protein-PII] uridylyltransferase